jgi:uncharacterized protein (TIGR03000 family)
MNCYYATYSAYSGYSCPAPYAPYASYAPYGCVGCVGCVGCAGVIDPYFSFGCSAGWGCAGWAPPVVCPPPPVIICDGPIVVPPAAEEPEPKASASDQQLDFMLKILKQIKSESKETEDRLKAIEADLKKLKKAIGPKANGPKPDKDTKPKKNKGDKSEAETEVTSAANPQGGALLLVKVPAGAKLFLDDQPTASQGKSERTIFTPTLQPGAKYSYNLRVEYQVGGTTYSQTRQVSFQAGQTVEVNFATDAGTPVETGFSPSK